MTELAPEPATRLASEDRHCTTCQCLPTDSDSLIVYPANERLYGRCDTCGQVRWETQIYTHHHGTPRSSHHCGCCAHPHDLTNGGHSIPTRSKP